jgi:hypothetical protein
MAFWHRAHPSWQVLLPASYTRIKPCFTAGKRIGVGNCHATCGHQRKGILTSIVYAWWCIFTKMALQSLRRLLLSNSPQELSSSLPDSHAPSTSKRYVPSYHCIISKSLLCFICDPSQPICERWSRSDHVYGRRGFAANHELSLTSLNDVVAHVRQRLARFFPPSPPTQSRDTEIYFFTCSDIGILSRNNYSLSHLIQIMRLAMSAAVICRILSWF